MDMTMEQECEQAILEYAPYYRQINAGFYGEYAEYVQIVVTMHRQHYYKLKNAGATEWTDLSPTDIQWLNENKPY